MILTSSRTGRATIIKRIIEVCVAVIALAACADAESPIQGTRSEQFAARLYESTTEDQQKALEDYKVTAAEYEQAVLAAKACMEDGGLMVSGPTPTAGGVILQLSFDGEGFNERYMDMCVEEHLNAIEWVWIDQNLPTESGRQNMIEELFSCLERDGIDIAGLSADSEDLFGAIADRITRRQSEGGDGSSCLADYGLLWIQPFDPATAG